LEHLRVVAIAGLLAVLPNPLSAQASAVHGRVLDAITETPVAAALVELVSEPHRIPDHDRRGR
jgi:hypothetical protein